jgi:hypothetical protein
MGHFDGAFILFQMGCKIVQYPNFPVRRTHRRHADARFVQRFFYFLGFVSGCFADVLSVDAAHFDKTDVVLL